MFFFLYIKDYFSKYSYTILTINNNFKILVHEICENLAQEVQFRPAWIASFIRPEQWFHKPDPFEDDLPIVLLSITNQWDSVFFIYISSSSKHCISKPNIASQYSVPSCLCEKLLKSNYSIVVSDTRSRRLRKYLIYLSNSFRGYLKMNNLLRPSCMWLGTQTSW